MSAAACGVRTNSGISCGSSSAAMPLVNSCPVAPQANAAAGDSEIMADASRLAILYRQFI